MRLTNCRDLLEPMTACYSNRGVSRSPNSKTEILRYFVDKCTLFLSEISLNAPVVHFTYVDPGQVDPGPYSTIVDFPNHLRSYEALFARMERFGCSIFTKSRTNGSKLKTYFTPLSDPDAKLVPTIWIS
jgi:hypothetical protein